MERHYQISSEWVRHLEKEKSSMSYFIKKSNKHIVIYMSFADSTTSLYKSFSIRRDKRMPKARIETKPIWGQSECLPLSHLHTKDAVSQI